jgi:hypothetical protein
MKKNQRAAWFDPSLATINARITRTRGGTAMRSASIVGRTDELPKEGKQFIIWAESFDTQLLAIGGKRRMNTSPVVKCFANKASFQITTESGSEYLIELL